MIEKLLQPSNLAMPNLPQTTRISHPLLESLPFTLFMTGVTLSTVFSALVGHKIFGAPLLFTVVDSVVYHLVYVVLALSAWYYVRFTWALRMPMWKLLMMRILVLASVIMIWSGTCYGILSVIFSGNATFLQLLELSLPAHVAGGLPYFLIIILGYILFIFIEDRRTRIDNELKLKENLREAEIELLKSQINPHFLFNSLNSVSMLTLSEPERAHTMIIALSDYLRYSISGHQNSMTTLKLELENVHRYLDIEKIRFGKRLAVLFQVPNECLQIPVPVMMLQPLFENAIKHGVYESTSQVEIRTIVQFVEEEQLEILISNNFETGRIARKGAGLGLKNVRDRLRMAYGLGQSHLMIEHNPNNFAVRIRIPGVQK